MGGSSSRDRLPTYTRTPGTNTRKRCSPPPPVASGSAECGSRVQRSTAELTLRWSPPRGGRVDSPMKASAMIVETNSIRQFAARLAGIGLLAFAAAHPAYATLGGAEVTVLADQ